jgi:hypothetical protein
MNQIESRVHNLIVLLNAQVRPGPGPGWPAGWGGRRAPRRPEEAPPPPSSPPAPASYHGPKPPSPPPPSSPPPARRVHGRRRASLQRPRGASRWPAGPGGPGRAPAIPQSAGPGGGRAARPRCPTTNAKGGSCQCSGWPSAPASGAGRGGGGAGACRAGPPARRPPPTEDGACTAPGVPVRETIRPWFCDEVQRNFLSC